MPAKENQAAKRKAAAQVDAVLYLVGNEPPMSETHPLLQNKTPEALALYHAFVAAFREEGAAGVASTKSMLVVEGPDGHAAYITQLGKNFLHVVFPFSQSFPDNLCFQKIAQVPGQQQYNHHFRMLLPEDVNDEVRAFMRRSLKPGR